MIAAWKNDHCKMATRRKKTNKNDYFRDNEEMAIMQYINETNEANKNKIFNKILYPALTTMIESIIRRYKLFVPDEEFDINFNDTISYLLTKINHFRPIITSYDRIEDETLQSCNTFSHMSKEDFRLKQRNAEPEDPEYVMVYFGKDETSGDGEWRYFKKTVHKYRAYSYCGTVCKNYLMYKSSQYSKKRKKNTSFDEVFEEINNSKKYTIDNVDSITLAEKLISDTATEIENMTNSPDEYELTDDEVLVGKVLASLLRNWETAIPTNGSSKLQKSSVLFYLREETRMTTKQVRDNMRPYKKLYYLLKQAELE